MNTETKVTLTLMKYLEISRYVGQLEGALMGARIVLANSDSFNVDAIDELLEWRPSLSTNVQTGEDND